MDITGLSLAKSKPLIDEMLSKFKSSAQLSFQKDHTIHEKSLAIELQQQNFIWSQWLDEKQAPLYIRNYIDKNIPLMDKSTFIPVAPTGIFEILFYGVFFCVSLFITWFYTKKIFITEVITLKITYGMLYTVLIFLTFFLAWILWQTYKDSKLNKKKLIDGKYRQGLFILDDGLILYTTKQYFFAPHSKIKKFILTRKDRKKPYDLKMQVYDQNNSLAIVSLEYLKQNNDSLHESLSKWLKTNDWKY